MCEHVYKIMGSKICPLCGGYTHEIDWELLKAQRLAHREEFGLLHTVNVWWSI
jgi:hypothetical protein